MQQGPSPEANSSSDSPDNPHILCVATCSIPFTDWPHVLTNNTKYPAHNLIIIFITDSLNNNLLVESPYSGYPEPAASNSGIGGSGGGCSSSSNNKSVIVVIAAVVVVVVQ